MTLARRVFHDFTRLRISGEKHYLALRMNGFELNAKINTIQLRHHDVGKEQIRAVNFSRVQRIQRVCEGDRIIIETLQDKYKCIGNRCFVIHDENAMFPRKLHTLPRDNLSTALCLDAGIDSLTYTTAETSSGIARSWLAVSRCDVASLGSRR